MIQGMQDNSEHWNPNCIIKDKFVCPANKSAVKQIGSKAATKCGSMFQPLGGQDLFKDFGTTGTKSAMKSSGQGKYGAAKLVAQMMGLTINKGPDEIGT